MSAFPVGLDIPIHFGTRNMFEVDKTICSVLQISSAFMILYIVSLFQTYKIYFSLILDVFNTKYNFQKSVAWLYG